MKYPLGALEDVPIKVGDFYVPVDLIILDMAKDAYTQIILERPFLATTVCKIDVKGGRLTFNRGEHGAEFGLFLDHESYPSSFPCGCDLVISIEIAQLFDVCLNDPHEFDSWLTRVMPFL